MLNKFNYSLFNSFKISYHLSFICCQFENVAKSFLPVGGIIPYGSFWESIDLNPFFPYLKKH